MECNKEEAIRAKEIAEKKMQNKDFEGARKIALRAQQLFPDLENISQMLTVCEVHCSAGHKLGSELDWYGILQIEQAANEVSIKKQYRKLALVLHPDKNKFAGAEAAFKLIGEAHRVLSDQAKRSIYDIRYRTSLGNTILKQPQQQNKNSFVQKEPGVSKISVNIASTQFTGVNLQQQQQKTQPWFVNGRETFWTACPFCNTRYQYYKNVLNVSLRCQNCTKPFTAYDLNAQGVTPRDNRSHSTIPQQKEVSSQVGHKFTSQSTVRNFPSSMGFQGNSGNGAPASEPFLRTGGTSEFGGVSCKKADANGDVNSEDGLKDKNKPKFESEKHNKSKKRRKSEAESSCGTDENEIIEEGSLPTGQNSGITGERYARRSVRQKQHVSYKEDLIDDDFVSCPKRTGESQPANMAENQSEKSLKAETNEPVGSSAAFEENKKVEKQKGSAPNKENLPSGNDKVEECKTTRNEAAVEDNKERSNVNNNFKSNSGSKNKPDPEFFNVPDPDFSDFDKDRKEECFAVDQMWAVYDDLDGMPRFYARIKKVFSPGFKVRITWLEADPDDQAEIDWFNMDLPVACGKFKHEKSNITEDIGMFSHLVSWEKGSSRSSYRIYPRTGETWALFKNWDIKWSSDPDNHRNYEFEFVVVLSDYVEESGITVAYLVKLKGFVSLFRLKKGMIPFQIPPNELFRFSHRVPSYRMTGTEREGVPEGYFELDPASLPDNLKEFADVEDLQVDIESKNSKFRGPSKSQVEDRSNALEKSINHSEKNTQDRRNSKGGNRSTKESNASHKKQSQSNISQCATNEIGMNIGPMKDSNHDVSENSPDSVSSLDPCEIPEPEFYDFDTEKTPEKFQPGQIWALYCELDGLPKYYAQINKIESSPNFKLHITWLEPCPLPKKISRWSDKDMPICCGTFKVATGKTEVYTGTSSFSHWSRAVNTGVKNRYEIYPRKGEVWALYNNFNSEWTCSDLDKCEYDIVEVLEADGSCIKVLVLELVDGFETVFKAKRKCGSLITTEIQHDELLKFSHRIPAFLLTEERDGSLRGCWELDPNSMPVHLFCPN